VGESGGELWFELGPFGITCNAIAPSMTLSKRIHARWEHMSDTEQAAMIARTPLRRLAQPEDQVRVTCFLASADADFVTGVTIDVTGGQQVTMLADAMASGVGPARDVIFIDGGMHRFAL
jgi:NAD(P)-dependent dehydrogenase (short-subunit alcohol dehydrogenase family)